MKLHLVTNYIIKLQNEIKKKNRNNNNMENKQKLKQHRIIMKKNSLK